MSVFEIILNVEPSGLELRIAHFTEGTFASMDPLEFFVVAKPNLPPPPVPVDAVIRYCDPLVHKNRQRTQVFVAKDSRSQESNKSIKLMVSERTDAVCQVLSVCVEPSVFALVSLVGWHFKGLGFKIHLGSVFISAKQNDALEDAVLRPVAWQIVYTLWVLRGVGVGWQTEGCLVKHCRSTARGRAETVHLYSALSVRIAHFVKMHGDLVDGDC